MSKNSNFLEDAVFLIRKCRVIVIEFYWEVDTDFCSMQDVPEIVSNDRAILYSL